MSPLTNIKLHSLENIDFELDMIDIIDFKLDYTENMDFDINDSEKIDFVLEYSGIIDFELELTSLIDEYDIISTPYTTPIEIYTRGILTEDEFVLSTEDGAFLVY